ncbi:LytTR family DNA-binding domain-containing protein [Pararhodobacter zhoushanensis]|uniref:LytTR family transcriptional regulator n=1 Tax=Pararhodobacter zhoushanensis TaxID=2479545 RepID=A0ABT3H2W8_9RHOB|nr:LytTR family DNA-binding domain-containing protein [Pararhodobacter zhoushanensis]MCW1934181.1 LytTR family transcriptional regulator [Pararhodobacter zhoushanensis]
MQREHDALTRLETVQDHAVAAALSRHPRMPLPTEPHSPDRGDSPDTPVPLLFEKLPESLGRDLISLRAQDHYVEVTTALGTTTVLLRLSDAERDLIPFNGMRVHRSWWVNLDHVCDLTRTVGGGMEVTTIDGQIIPVARGQRTAVRQALDERRSAAE